MKKNSEPIVKEITKVRPPSPPSPSRPVSPVRTLHTHQATHPNSNQPTSSNSPVTQNSPKLSNTSSREKDIQNLKPGYYGLFRFSRIAQNRNVTENTSSTINPENAKKPYISNGWIQDSSGKWTKINENITTKHYVIKNLNLSTKTTWKNENGTWVKTEVNTQVSRQNQPTSTSQVHATNLTDNTAGPQNTSGVHAHVETKAVASQAGQTSGTVPNLQTPSSTFLSTSEVPQSGTNLPQISQVRSELISSQTYINTATSSHNTQTSLSPEIPSQTVNVTAGLSQTLQSNPTYLSRQVHVADEVASQLQSNFPQISSQTSQGLQSNLQTPQSTSLSTLSDPNSETSQVSSIPIAPPLPSIPIVIAQPTLQVTEELKAIKLHIDSISNHNNETNLKPSHISNKPKPFTQQEKADEKASRIKFINTKINENTNSSHIDDFDLLEEMRIRGFIKTADKNEVKVLTETGQDVIIGKSINNVKITPLGQAYLNKVEKTILFANTEDPALIEYKIAVLPTGNNVFISSGKQKHLVVAYNKTTNEYHLIGYLSSKKSGIFLDNKQFKNYQNEKTSGIQSKEGKKQYLMEFPNAECISKDELTFIAYGTEYIHSLNLHNIEELRKELNKKSFSNYDSQNYSKQQAIMACIAHDKNVNEKKPHPKTMDEVKIVEANKVKVKKLFEEKRKSQLEQSKDEDNNDNEETK